MSESNEKNGLSDVIKLLVFSTNTANPKKTQFIPE